MCCLGSASDWLNQISHAARPIRSTTQIWVVTRHQYGTSALVSHTGEETRGSVAKKMPEAWKIRNWQKIKTESTRKLSNFNFQWIKPCTRIISITLYFLTLFEGYKCNKLYEITLKKKLSWKPEKTNFKSFKFHKMKSCAWRGFYVCFLKSCEIWSLFCRVWLLKINSPSHWPLKFKQNWLSSIATNTPTPFSPDYFQAFFSHLHKLRL